MTEIREFRIASGRPTWTTSPSGSPGSAGPTSCPTRYGAHGNDAGSLISPEVGRRDPEHVIGVHVTQLFAFPSGDPAELAGLSEADQQKVQFRQRWLDHGGTYDKLRSTAPQALADSRSANSAGMRNCSA
ncbi:hypothetical protein [Micromonospora sp. CPCC 205558]|uniref:hypothetical protein n=1 Tax=Micromonospora sp. CPCC 205558 TaxID=3122403 RepID=UPI002FF21C4E